MNPFSIGLVAILAGSSVVPAQDGRRIVVSEEHRNSYHVQGRRLRFVIRDSLLSTTPQWARPDAGAPPLPMKKAINIARAVLGRYVEDPSKWRLHQITLRCLGRRPMWYYVVEWFPAWEGYMGDGIGIPVLMSGKAVALETDLQTDALKASPSREGSAAVNGM